MRGRERGVDHQNLVLQGMVNHLGRFNQKRNSRTKGTKTLRRGGRLLEVEEEEGKEEEDKEEEECS